MERRTPVVRFEVPHISALLKSTIPFFIVILCFAHQGALYGQTAKGINYQAVARNAETGVELSNQQVFLIAKIRRGGAAGAIVYQEEHGDISTNLYGLFGLEIGAGDAIDGSFDTIDWGSGDFWLDLEIDAGNGMEQLSAMKFVAVPYALHAETVSDKDDADADPDNEKITDFSIENGLISITESGVTRTVDIPESSDADSDPENEIQNLTITNNVLSITGNTDPLSIDLESYRNDADSDPTNERISIFDYNPETAVLSMTEGNQSWTHDLSGLAGDGAPDGDSSPTNELQNLTLTGDVLSIDGTASPLSVNLANYRNDADSNIGNEHVNSFGIASGKLRLTQNGGGTTFEVPLTSLNVADGDGDPNNEKITGWSSSGGVYTFAEAGTNYSINTNDADASPTNEIQNLTLTGDVLSINGTASPLSVNLANYRNDADSNIGNEHVNGFGIASGKLRLTQNGGGATFDIPLADLNIGDGDSDPNNEKITGWSSSGGVITFAEAGTNYSINTNDADASPTNEIQNLTLTGDVLSINGTASPLSVNLANYRNDADSNIGNEHVNSFGIASGKLRLTQNGGGTTFNVPLADLNIADGDGDPNNEKITGWSSSGGVITFAEAGTNYSINTNDADASPTNEIQNLTLSGDVLSIDGTASPLSVNLANYRNDADSNIGNEHVNSFGIASGKLRLTQNGGGTTFEVPLTSLNVADGDGDPNNEKITGWSSSGGVINFAEAGNNYSFSINDTDADPSNELQNLKYLGGIVSITGIASPVEVNLEDYRDDADADPENEKQTLAQVLNYAGPLGNLDGRDAGGNKIRNLGAPTSGNDAATKTYVDNQSHAGDVTGTYNNLKVVRLQNRNVSSAAPSNGDVLKYNSAQSRWEPGVANVLTANTGTGYYQIDPLDFVALRKDDKQDKYNIVVNEEDERFVTIRKEDEGQYIGAAVHLPHGAVIEYINLSFKVRKPGNRDLVIKIQRKELTTGIMFTMASETYDAPSNNDILRTETLDLSGNTIDQLTVDNSKYSYRMIARFVTNQDFDGAEDAEIQLHGAVVKYTY